MQGIQTQPARPRYFPGAPQLDQHEKMKMMSNSYERAGTLGFRCVKDVKPARACGKVCGRWSGPPTAFTALASYPAGPAPLAWARWTYEDGRIKAVRSGPSAPDATGLAQLPTPLCAGTAVATTAGDGARLTAATPMNSPYCSCKLTRSGHAGVSFTGVAGINATAAVGSPCGFTLAVKLAADGPQTLTLFGGSSQALTVTVTAAGGPETAVVTGLPLSTLKAAKGQLVDTHIHVAIDGAAGELVTVAWTVNASAPAPAPPGPSRKDNFTTLSRTACMPQHGASAELGNTTEKSVPACTAQCSADDRCSCVVFTPESGQCQRMAQCLPSKCAANVQQKTTLVKDYQVAVGETVI